MLALRRGKNLNNLPTTNKVFARVIEPQAALQCCCLTVRAAELSRLVVVMKQSHAASWKVAIVVCLYYLTLSCIAFEHEKTSLRTLVLFENDSLQQESSRFVDSLKGSARSFSGPL